MIGYGINNNNTNPPPSFNPDMVLSSENASGKQNHPKKELTLTEKHELASKLEKDLSFDNTNKNASSMNNSMSLNNFKSLSTNNSNNNSRNLTDSLMDRNLADLNFNTSTNKSTMPSSASTNFSMPMQTSTQNRFPTSNNFNGQNNTYGNMGNASFQRPPFQQQQHQNSFNNQQMGFFGNLALPAPGDAASKSGFPNIMPPPSINTLKPATNLNSFNKTSPQPGKKSALDDLADIFG